MEGTEYTANHGTAPWSQDPAPASQGPAPATEGPAPWRQDPAPATEGPAPATEGPAPATEGPAPWRQNPAPATEGPAPQLSVYEDDWEDIDDDWLDEERFMAQVNNIIDPHVPRAPGADGTLTVVDISGVHSIPVHYCHCAGAEPPHLQLLQLRLFPTSCLRPRTVFTFHVLDDFLQHNVVCKTSAHNYYTLLRRKTNSTFPDMVPVCNSLLMYSSLIFLSPCRIGTES